MSLLWNLDWTMVMCKLQAKLQESDWRMWSQQIKSINSTAFLVMELKVLADSRFAGIAVSIPGTTLANIFVLSFPHQVPVYIQWHGTLHWLICEQLILEGSPSQTCSSTRCMCWAWIHRSNGALQHHTVTKLETSRGRSLGNSAILVFQRRKLHMETWVSSH